MTHVTDAALGKLARQQNDLFRRVREGTLDAQLVSRGIQNIIDSKFALRTWSQSIWWRTAEQQLERARQLWPNVVLPEPPTEFTPRTKSEVLLLHVPDSFDSLWDKVVAPTGYTKCREENVKSDKQNLRLSPNKREYTEPVWLGFDPEHDQGTRRDACWGQDNIAASEVFSALIQFPEWPLAWFNGASLPCLSGYQLERHGQPLVPYLFREDSHYRLWLGVTAADSRGVCWASPLVREC